MVLIVFRIWFFVNNCQLAKKQQYWSQTTCYLQPFSKEDYYLEGFPP
jgi:hypothetical protein